MKADFYITYHHADEMAARWIASELKQGKFSTLSDSWDFLPGEVALEKIDFMFRVSRFVMVLVSGKFLESLGELNISFSGVQGAVFQKSPMVAEGIVFPVRIDSCEIEKVLGDIGYIDLADINEKEAVKRLLEAVGATATGKKEIGPLPVSAGTRDEILAKRKQEMDQLLAATIKNNYHMKLDLEQEVLKEVEVENERTGEKEKRKEWVWEPVPLETVLKDEKDYILVNPSGMGKTTFLSYAACAFLDQEANNFFLPLFFTCIALNNRGNTTIEDFIRHQVEFVYTGTQGAPVSGEWENLCILIDALDQARDVDDIVSSLLLHDKLLHYKKAKIILSSRQNTADKVKEGFAKIRLKLPEAEEVRHYLGEENYQRLAGIIEASGELVKAPVLLEMLKIITEKGQVVSTLFNRADLYTEFTKVLLDQERSKPRFWQDRLSIRHFIDFELEQTLEKIAFFSLADNQILEIPKEKLAQYCQSPGKKEALLNVGILLELFEDREQKIVFRHQSFQAYFASRYIYNQQPELFKELTIDVAFFYNDMWYEVMRFFAGQEKDLKKVEKIIKTIYLTKDKIIDLNYSLRLIFAIFLMSELQVNNEFVQQVYMHMRNLLKNNKQYLDFFNSNCGKFNNSNIVQRRKFFIFITPLLRDNNEDVRSSAVGLLGKIAKAQDINLVERMLKDKNEFVRLAAVEILGKIGGKRHIPILEPLLGDRDLDVRRAATKALEYLDRLKDSHLSKSQLRDIDDGYPHFVLLSKLGNIVSSQDIPTMNPRLRKIDTLLRRKFHKQLVKIIPRNHTHNKHGFPITPLRIEVSPYVAEDFGGIRSYAKLLGEIDPAIDLPNLEPKIRNIIDLLRCNAAELLGRIGTSKDIPLLEPLLKASNKDVKRIAIKALGEIGTPTHVSLLEPLLWDENWDIRRAAVETLGKIGTSEHIPLLEALLKDEDSDVHCAIVEAIGNIGASKNISLLAPSLTHWNSKVRRATAEAFGKIGTVNDIPFLESLLKYEDWEGRSEAVVAIENIYTRSTPKLRLDRVLPIKKDEKVLPFKLFASKALHILHISDIHYALANDPTITCIFHEFLNDIQKWRAQQNNTNIHSICLTGDIAQSGQENQYDSINEKINAILNTTGCAKENLFIIPGNHDVQDFHEISDQGKTLLEQVRDNQMNIDTGVLSIADNYREFHNKFAHYYRFIENAGYLNSLPENHNDIPKSWFNRKLKDFPVRIIGLNSALFCLKDFCQYGNIRMGIDQFHEAFFQRKIGGKPENELVILLTHHPLNWLAENEYDDYSTLMERYSIIHLHGHIHKTHIEKKQRLFSSSGGYISIGTGSLYGEKGKEDINTYHIITLDFENHEVVVWARRWNPDLGKWTVYDDDGNNRFPLPTNYSNYHKL